MTVDELEQKIQKVAEQRLMEGWEFVHEENDGETLTGPFCGCDTCVVREVVTAAWPYLYELAHHPDTDRPES